MRKVMLALIETKDEFHFRAFTFFSNTAMCLCVRPVSCGLTYKCSKIQSPNLPKRKKVQDPYLYLDPYLNFVSSQESVIEALKVYALWIFHLSQPNSLSEHHF